MIKKNKFRLIISSVVILLPIFIGLLLPDFNFNGKIGMTGSKILLVFGIPLFLFALHWFGILLTVHDPNNIDQSQKVLNMVIWIVPVISLIVSGISYSLALGNTININIIVRILLGVMFVILGNYMPKCKQNYTIGVRVTWALRNEENWNKTHRFTGRLWVLGGLFMLATMLIPLEKFMFVYLFIILFMAFVPMLYSYLYYRKQLKMGTASKDDSAQIPLSRRTTIIALVAGSIIVVLAMVFLFTGNYDIKFDDSSFTIDAAYWDDTTVNYSDIDDIEYRNELVPGTRTFGYGSPSLIMGECENDEFGNYTRYAFNSCDACIVLTIDDKKLVINGKTEELTKEIYDELTLRINK